MILSDRALKLAFFPLLKERALNVLRCHNRCTHFFVSLIMQKCHTHLFCVKFCEIFMFMLCKFLCTSAIHKIAFFDVHKILLPTESVKTIPLWLPSFVSLYVLLTTWSLMRLYNNRTLKAYRGRGVVGTNANEAEVMWFILLSYQ